MINPQQARSAIAAIIRMALSKFVLSQSMTDYFRGSDGVEKSMISMRIAALTSSRPRITFNSPAAVGRPWELLTPPGDCPACGAAAGAALAGNQRTHARCILKGKIANDKELIGIEQGIEGDAQLAVFGGKGEIKGLALQTAWLRFGLPAALRRVFGLLGEGGGFFGQGDPIEAVNGLNLEVDQVRDDLFYDPELSRQSRRGVLVGKTISILAESEIEALRQFDTCRTRFFSDLVDRGAKVILESLGLDVRTARLLHFCQLGAQGIQFRFVLLCERAAFFEVLSIRKWRSILEGVKLADGLRIGL